MVKAYKLSFLCRGVDIPDKGLEFLEPAEITFYDGILLQGNKELLVGYTHNGIIYGEDGFTLMEYIQNQFVAYMLSEPVKNNSCIVIGNVKSEFYIRINLREIPSHLINISAIRQTIEEKFSELPLEEQQKNEVIIRYVRQLT